MKRHTLEGQIKSIQKIQAQIKTYLRWKECGTQASFFSRSELDNHLFNLNLINTLTDNPKVAKKSHQLLRLLARILEKEYDEIPKFHIYGYRTKRELRQHGTKTISTNQGVSPKRNTSRSSNDPSPEKNVEQHVQKVSTSRKSTVQDKQMEEPDQSSSTRRNRSDNLPLPQRSARRTLRPGQNVSKTEASIPLAKDVRRSKTVHRIMPSMSSSRKTKEEQRTSPYTTHSTLGKSRDRLRRTSPDHLKRQ